jgi:hypothetical protein
MAKNIKSSEIAGSFFRRSLATEELKVGGTEIVFHVQALPDLVLSHIRREAEDADGRPDELRLMNLFIKFGLVGVDNLTDESGAQVEFATETMTILGKDFKCATDQFVEGISRGLRAQITSVIAEMTELSPNEQKRLELFRKGGSKL